MTQFKRILQTLVDHDVEFILIGGLAAIAHGSVRNTVDIDIVYHRTPENIRRLVRSVSHLDVSLRGAPPGLPFKFDELTVKQGLNFTLSTIDGPLDVMGEVAGDGTYDKLLSRSERLKFLGLECLCVDLDTLIHLKRSAGRKKDLLAVADLEALKEESRKLDAE